MRLAGLVLVLAACPSQPHTSTTGQPRGKPLFDRIGGMDGLKGIMTDFVEEQLDKDGRINVRFTRVDKPQFVDALAVQLCELSGGPCHYTGRQMKDAHANLAITGEDFSAFVDDLQKSLVKFKVAEPEQRELLAIVQHMRDQIVE